MSAPLQLPSRATVGRSASLYIGAQTGATGTEVWVKVSEAISIERSGLKRSTIKTTNLDSGEYDTYLSTQIDGGTWSISANRIPTDAGYLAVIAAMNVSGGPAYDFKVQLPIDTEASQTTAGDVYTFSGIITDVDGFSLDVDKAIQWKLVLQQSGPSTYVVGS
jgi:hypothetical protein